MMIYALWFLGFWGVGDSSARAEQPAAKPQTQSVKTLTNTAGRTPAGNLATGEVDRPLRIEGQARNLNMMLMLKGEKDRIKFGEVRESYVDDVRRTNY